MTVITADYPGAIWDGLSTDRSLRSTDTEPRANDWDQAVAEILALQTQLGIVPPRHVKVTVTSAQILLANTTPTVVLAAPGANLVNIIDRVVVRNEFLTGAYAYTGVANLSYTDETGAIVVAMDALFLETAATAIASIPSTLLTGAAAATRAVADAAIVFGTTDADPTTGAGSLIFDIYYRTIATA